MIRLNKDDAFVVGQNLQSDVRRKANIIKVIAEHVVDNDVFEEDMLQQVQMDTQELTPTKLKLEKARIAACVVIDKARIEQESKSRELVLKERNNRA